MDIGEPSGSDSIERHGWTMAYRSDYRGGGMSRLPSGQVNKAFGEGGGHEVYAATWDL
jgi:hypothetical protein